ncbi:DUF2200 family protein [Patescibacteria group bacterium]|nr:MAG: DUF2200 family protein [Patescibacteria group bacterium]
MRNRWRPTQKQSPPKQLQAVLLNHFWKISTSDETTLEDFFAKAPKLHPNRKLITGVICGVRVEDIEDKTMQEIRYLDKLIDELAKGKAMEKILRS